MDEPLTDREVLILSLTCSVVFLFLLIGTVLLIWVCQKRRRRNREKQEHLSRTLESISLRDPLDELVRRESRRSFYEEVALSDTENVLEYNDSKRKMFKIWTCDRKIRAFVFATEVQEILDKGSTQLGLVCPSRLVLEEDGTEIDNDEVLRACTGRTFMILERNDRWIPKSMVLNVDDLTNTQSRISNGDVSTDVAYL